MNIDQLEQQLHTLKTKATLTKIDKAEIERLKQLIKSAYADSKATVVTFEKTNYNYLIFLKSTNNFYKLTGHSALFYTNSIAPKLGLSARLQTDGDFIAKSAEGVVSIRNLDQIAKRLAELHILKVKTKKDPNVVVYKLPWNFTNEQIENFQNESQLKMKKFNQIILVDNISPTLLLQIIDLIKAVYENIRALPNPTERETIGYDCIKFAVKMEHSYLDIGNGRINRITGLREIQSSLNKVKNYTKILADLRLWQPKTCARIAENILTIQNIIMRELKND